MESEDTQPDRAHTSAKVTVESLLQPRPFLVSLYWCSHLVQLFLGMIALFVLPLYGAFWYLLTLSVTQNESAASSVAAEVGFLYVANLLLGALGVAALLQLRAGTLWGWPLAASFQLGFFALLLRSHLLHAQLSAALLISLLPGCVLVALLSQRRSRQYHLGRTH